MRTKLFVRVTPILMLFVGVATAGPEGVLVIVGGGNIPADVREEFFKLAGGKDKARIVVLPTASATADDPKQDDAFLKPWRDLGPISAQLLHTRDRKVADDPAFVKPLVKATAVWISGGDQNRLIAAYRGTLLETELHKLLQRGGVIGGTSAGAAVMSDLMIEGGNPKARTGPGFGFLKGIVVDQHFAARNRIDRLRGVLAKNNDFGGLGIDEGTAAIIRGHSLTIKGSSTVTAIWSQSSSQPAKEKTFKAGAVLDLASLCPTPKPK
jgi:cyanophycinase